MDIKILGTIQVANGGVCCCVSDEYCEEHDDYCAYGYDSHGQKYGIKDAKARTIYRLQIGEGEFEIPLCMKHKHLLGELVNAQENGE